jgi:hypothetical protein
LAQVAAGVSDSAACAVVVRNSPNAHKTPPDVKSLLRFGFSALPCDIYGVDDSNSDTATDAFRCFTTGKVVVEANDKHCPPIEGMKSLRRLLNRVSGTGVAGGLPQITLTWEKEPDAPAALAKYVHRIGGGANIGIRHVSAHGKVEAKAVLHSRLLITTAPLYGLLLPENGTVLVISKDSSDCDCYEKSTIACTHCTPHALHDPAHRQQLNKDEVKNAEPVAVGAPGGAVQDALVAELLRDKDHTAECFSSLVGLFVEHNEAWIAAQRRKHGGIRGEDKTGGRGDDS